MKVIFIPCSTGNDQPSGYDFQGQTLLLASAHTFKGMVCVFADL